MVLEEFTVATTAQINSVANLVANLVAREDTRQTEGRYTFSGGPRPFLAGVPPMNPTVWVFPHQLRQS